MPVDETRDVLPGDDRLDALDRLGLLRVELLDPGVVDRRAQRLRPEHVRDADVVDELRPPGDMGDAVIAREPCADGLHAGLPGIITSGSPSLGSGMNSRSPTSPRAAPSTASRIFTYPVHRHV